MEKDYSVILGIPKCPIARNKGPMKHVTWPIEQPFWMFIKLNTSHPVYRCGSADGWSPLFFFKALQDGVDWSPRLAIYGDMGNENAQSLGRLQVEAQDGCYDAILHIGKLYNDKAS